MSYHHKNAFVALGATLIAYAAFLVYALPPLADGGFDGAEGLRRFARVALAALGGAVALHMVGAILFNIVHAILTRDPAPSFTRDERDEAIELRALRLMLWIAGGGLVLALALIAFGLAAPVGLTLILLSFAAGDVVAGAWRLRAYRRGF